MALTKQEQKVIALLEKEGPLCTGEIRDSIELDTMGTMGTIVLLQDLVKRGLIKDLGTDDGDNEYDSI